MTASISHSFTLDTWTSFVRTYDPNCDRAFLAARGFTKTTTAVGLSGPVAPDRRAEQGLPGVEGAPVAEFYGAVYHL